MVLEKILAWITSPTFFKTMQGRYENLIAAYDGYRLTGVPLIAYTDSHIAPAGNGDDLGLYHFVPRLMTFFDGDVQSALLYFWGGVILVSMILGITGFFRLNSNWRLRSISLLGVALVSLLLVLAWDVYIMLGAVPLAILPLFLSFFVKNKFTIPFYFFAFSAGALAAVGHFVRSHAATAVLLFVWFAVLFMKEKLAKKGLFLLVLALGFSIPTLYFKMAVENRNAYLKQTSSSAVYDDVHTFWLPIYVGLGYLKNDFGLTFNDSVGYQIAREKSPGVNYLSREYEEIIKNETIKFISSHPLFFLKSILAKGMVLVLYFVLAANIGILASLKHPKPWPIEAAFFIALLFSSLFGLLVIPSPKYVLGFIVIAMIYGIFSVCYALQYVLTDITGRRRTTL